MKSSSQNSFSESFNVKFFGLNLLKIHIYLISFFLANSNMFLYFLFLQFLIVNFYKLVQN